MTNWYASQEAVKRMLSLKGPDRDHGVRIVIGAASREIERCLDRRFIPVTKKNEYPYPQRDGRAGRLYIEDDDLLAVTLLTKRGDDEIAMASTDWFLEPVNRGPPYWFIDIDHASANFFEAHAQTNQRAIRVTGRWGFSEDTEPAGTVIGSDINDTTTLTFDCSDGSLIDVGDSLLIGTELLFVKSRQNVDSGAETTGSLTAKSNDVTVSIDRCQDVLPNEIILIDSERMRVESRSATSGAGNLTVERAVDGSVLVAHNTAAQVDTFRRLTVTERGGNGTAAAAHATTAAINRYVVPEDVYNATMALAEFYYGHGTAGWTGELGGGDRISESRGTLISKLTAGVKAHYGRPHIGAV